MKNKKKYENNSSPSFRKIAPALGLASLLAIAPIGYSQALESPKMAQKPSQTGCGDVASSPSKVNPNKSFAKELNQEELLCQQLELKLENLHSQQELTKARQESKRAMEKLALVAQQLKKIQSEKALLADQTKQDQERIEDLQNRLNETIENHDTQLRELAKERQKELHKVAVKVLYLENEKKSALQEAEKQQILHEKELAALNEEKNSLQNYFSQAESISKTQAEALQRAEKALNKSREQESRYSAALAKISQENEMLQRQIANAESLALTKAQQLEDKYSTALFKSTEENEMLRSQLARAEQTKKEQSYQLAQLEEQRQQRHSELETLRNQLATTKQIAIKSAHELEEKYNAVISKHTQQNKALRAHLAAAEQTKGEQAILLANLEGRSQLLQDEMENQKNYAQALATQVSEYEEQKEQLMASLANTHDMLGMYQSLFNAREDDLEQISTVLQNAGYAMDSMRDSLANVKEAIAKNEYLKEQLQQTHNNFLELHQKAESIASQLEATQEQFVSTEELFHSALDAHAILANEHRENKRKLEENEKTIADLRSSSTPNQKPISRSFNVDKWAQRLTAGVGVNLD